MPGPTFALACVSNVVLLVLACVSDVLLLFASACVSDVLMLVVLVCVSNSVLLLSLLLCETSVFSLISILWMCSLPPLLYVKALRCAGVSDVRFKGRCACVVSFLQLSVCWYVTNSSIMFVLVLLLTVVLGLHWCRVGEGGKGVGAHGWDRPSSCGGLGVEVVSCSSSTVRSVGLRDGV